MYFVKLDLSVSGLPASATRGCTRHVAKTFLAESPIIAIEKAQRLGDAPRHYSAVDNLFNAVLNALLNDHVLASSDVVMTARYTAIDCKNHKTVATYTSYFDFNDVVD